MKQVASCCWWLVTITYAYFVPNQGQWQDEQIWFRAEENGFIIEVTAKGLRFRWLSFQEKEEKGFYHNLYLYLKDASLKKERSIVSEQAQGYFNYIYPWCRLYQVRQYKRLEIKEVYPGIDWVLYSNEKGFKYEFVVHPGADPGQIRLCYHSKGVPMIENGNLRFDTPYGTLTEMAPVSFVNGERIESYYRILSIKPLSSEGYETEVMIVVGDYDRSKPLVIDPPLWWATFFGGGGLDGAQCATTLNNGDFVVSGYVTSGDLPLQDPGSGAYFDGALNGSWDVMIVRFNNNGVLLWSTYYGGSDKEEAYDVTHDSNDNIFVVGYTRSADFPLQPWGSAYFDNVQAGPTDDEGFVARFNNLGQLQWATFVGGDDGDEELYHAAIDANDNLFVVGYSDGIDYPIASSSGSAYVQGYMDRSDWVITKFDASGQMIWSTYYGGLDREEATGIAIDPITQAIYVTGWVESTDFPVFNPGGGAFFQGTNAGGRDIAIVKFANDGTRLWATYYGGSGDEDRRAVSTIVDDLQNCFVTFKTASFDVPTQNAPGAYFQGSLAGASDFFIIKFDAVLQRVWATYVGGPDVEHVRAYDNLTKDNCGNIYITFSTRSSSGLPLVQPCDYSSGGYFDNTYNGGTDGSGNPGYDIFLMVINSSGGIVWSTYFGGEGSDFHEAPEVDINGNLFLTGEWTAPNEPTYPLTDPGGGAYYDPTYNGPPIGGGPPSPHDSYMAKFLYAPCLCGVMSSSKLHLKATLQNHYVQLQWENPQKEDGIYEIQKSKNLYTWQTIHTTYAPSGTLYDTLLEKGKYYYRVHFRTMSGEQHFSNIAVVELKQKPWWMQLKQNQLIIYTSKEDEFILYDYTGKALASYRLNAGLHRLPFTFPSGIYLLRQRSTAETKKLLHF